MSFEIEITRNIEKDIKRLAKRAAMIEAEISALIRRAATGVYQPQEEPGEATETSVKAFHYLMNWCSEHRERFIGQGATAEGRIAGRWHETDDHIYIYSEIANQLLRDGGYHIKPILRDWRDTGRMRTGKDQLRYTVQMRIIPGQVHVRVYALRIPEKKLASPENNH